MLEKLTTEEIEFMECFHDPICLAETLFSDYDNMAMMSEDQLAHVRLGQIPLLSYEYLLDEDEELSEKDNFRLKEGAGNLWCLGGRKFGKTLFVEIVDLLISFILLEGYQIGFSSADHIHIKGILEKIVQVLENHPFFRLLKVKINRSPNYTFYATETGVTAISVNMNVQAKNPGAQFFQKHFHKLFIEEASFETEQVHKKRLDSVSENGCIMRISGMTNFTKISPCGRVFNELEKSSWVCNLPQYVNPKWDKKQKNEAIKEHGGEQTITYRMFVKGEVVEEDISVFDMERVRKNYDDKHIIKNFEVTKNNFNDFEYDVIVERPKNAENLFIFADIGDGGAPSEIGIISEVNQIYKYIYNITLYNLTDKQQFRFFRWLGEKMQANYMGLDCTDGTGRSIFRSLEEVFPKGNLISVGFNEKIPVDFQKDEITGNPKFDKNGKPLYQEEFTSEWSIRQLRKLFYAKRFNIPLDFKLDSQLNSVISMQSGTRTLYKCTIADNHLFQAFQVFAIMVWFVEFSLIKPITTKKFCKSGV